MTTHTFPPSSEQTSLLMDSQNPPVNKGKKTAVKILFTKMKIMYWARQKKDNQNKLLYNAPIST